MEFFNMRRELAGQRILITGASIGVAMHPPLPNHAGDLIKRADAAMYAAKQEGKRCVRHAAG